MFLQYTFELFFVLENKLIGYAYDTTLIAIFPSPGDRVTVADTLSSDFVKVSEWCDLWRMKMIANKTKTMIVSRSRIMLPQSPSLTIGGTVLKESDDLAILGVIFDTKMTLASLGKDAMIDFFLGRCFQGYVLPVSEYCSAV